MKRYKPTTPSRRNMTTVTHRGVLTTDVAFKGLTHGFKRSMGRNNRGRITTRHKGGGNKRMFRDVDFFYDKKEIPAKITTVEYDPNRTAFIGLAVYADGEKRYVVVPKSIKAGDSFLVGEKAEIKPANRLPLSNIPVGTFVYNIEIKPKGGSKLVRSAGNYAEVIGQDGGYTQIKLPSTEVRKIIDTAWATVGEVSNDENWLQNLGKAGKSRWRGIRPTVRGTAMNPVDHPHGGGEGRQGRGRRRAISIYGKPTGKGQKSRRPKKYSNRL
ncbi:MAG: large subunit ribosomal protein, partial [Patescibacteria group bacterium]|nr:large subunit ribosomal protein [Patescibacteria group bacterium]